MRVPLLRRNSRLTAVIPALSGGVDRRRSPWLIADNALADGENVWWKDGALRAREGFYTTAYRKQTVADGQYRFFIDRDGWTVSAEISDNGTAAQASLRAVDKNGEHGRILHQLSLPSGGSVCAVPSGGSLDGYTVLSFLSNGKIFGASPSTNSVGTGSAPYVPTVLIDGRPSVLITDRRPIGTPYEQYNRLTDRFCCQYTSDGQGLYYRLPKRSLIGEVMVVTTDANGNEEGFSIPADSSVSPSNAEGLCVQVDRARGYVCFFQGKTAILRPESEQPGDVCITAASAREDTLDPYHMRFGTWYGGRLFLAGHPQYPDRVIWSAPDDPTCFPEDNWAAVGDPHTAVTAFGKQDGALVIFKEREIYAAQYEANTDAKAGEPTARFPLTPLHTAIGCDLPYTPALLGNRLVWACADGSVYRLSAITTAGKSGVTAIGEAVRPLLGCPPTVAHGRVCDGRYFLLWDDRLLCLTDAEAPVWYIHRWHDEQVAPVALGGGHTRLLIAAQQDTQRWWFTMEGERDVFPENAYKTEAVTGMLCTKSYDFGMPDTFKSVISASAEVTSVITPVYVTECSEFTDRPHRPDRSGLVRCTPHIDRCRRLALRLTGVTGAVGGITLGLRGDMR